MEHRGKNAKLCGAWKVYGDAEAAKNTLIVNEEPDDEGITKCKALGAALAQYR